MAAPNDLNINSPTESSEEEFSDSEISYSSKDDSSEDEPSELENINGESHSFLSSLEQKDTLLFSTVVPETKPSDTEDDFWIRYPYLKIFLDETIAKGLFSEYAYERAKLIGDDKAEEINDRCRALCIKELKFISKKYAVIASVISLMIP